MVDQKPLRAGIVGTGIFATNNHLPSLQALDSKFTPAAAFNRTKAKAEEFAKLAGITEDHVHDSLEGIINDETVDFLDILLPVQHNLATVTKAVEAGKPVLMEKPIAATVADAKAIVALDRSTDVPIMIGENWLYFQIGKKIQENLSKIGNIVSFTYKSTGPFNTDNVFLATSWRQKPEHIGGFLSDGGVHQLALLTSCVGPIASVSALTKQLRQESGTDDILFSTCKAESGAIGTFTYGSAFGATEKVGEFIIYGDAGSIKADFRPKAKSSVTVMTGATAKESKTEAVIEFDEDKSFGIQPELENLYEAITKKDKSLIVAKPEIAFHHLAIIAAALESSKKNGDSVAVEKP
ncbi:CYFA0S07e00628g1_1 [Cyberlindnera fabianii]|uniref:CYFA0S07e00628g1_1 n=1 Tax=Cyberlindnera fabianii TaxID=36022 RepID=A0A061AVU6_CYBFA|nr:putative oxidoreductase YjhC [Cyberlindnera fabianii]CDR41316.1 CYFA0S07e00628g1_1 [Cyberlindnera fabianii]